MYKWKNEEKVKSWPTTAELKIEHDRAHDWVTTSVVICNHDRAQGQTDFSCSSDFHVYHLSFQHLSPSRTLLGQVFKWVNAWFVYWDKTENNRAK